MFSDASPEAFFPRQSKALSLRLFVHTWCPVCRTGRLRVVAVFQPSHLPAPALDVASIPREDAGPWRVPAVRISHLQGSLPPL